MMQLERMDAATVLGLLGSFSLVLAAMLLGGAPTAFVDLPAMLIVIGGTFFVTMMCFSIAEVVRAQRVVLQAVLRRAAEPSAAARRVLRLAEQARKQGLLSLQDVHESLSDTPFLQKALALVVDGMTADEAERLLRDEAAAMAHRHHKSASVFRKAAEVAPAMGLIGTLVGLVQMLGRLDDPSSIGPGMAVALLTTFYGAVLGNMLFAPLAAKLERNSEEESLLQQLFLTGATSIARQENPRRLEMVLNAILPPAHRVRFFD